MTDEGKGRPYFKEQLISYAGKLERDEILRRAEVQKHKELLKQAEGRHPNFRSYAAEYSYATDIHGMKYLFERRSLCEKIFWAVVVIVSLILCWFFVILELEKYNGTSTLVSFNSEDFPIYNTKFPAVTICPGNQFRQNFSDFMEGKDRVDHRRILQQITTASQFYFLYCGSDVTAPNITDVFDLDLFFDMIEKIQQPIANLFIRCQLFGRVYNCSDLFFPTLTSEGVCYTFNMLTREELFTNTTYHYGSLYQSKPSRDLDDLDDNFLTETYPFHALLSGINNGLQIILKQNETGETFPCKLIQSGFKVTLHTSNSVPLPAGYNFIVPLNTFILAGIDPKVFEIHERVSKMLVSKRQCFLKDERKLDFFQIYNQRNCHLECFTKFILTNCDCVMFYMPRMKDMPICAKKKMECMKKASEKWKFLKAQSVVHMGYQYCACRPACWETEYDNDFSVNDWDWKGYFFNEWNEDVIKMREQLNLTRDQLSFLNIYFKNQFYQSVVRYEWHGISDLLSTIGGFLSFFTGMSIVSVMEIIYFLSLRLICNRVKHGKWAGPK